ncbi:MAG TPA: hypothetical protein H9811_00455 [Candidatus Gemmiger excrementigallinarum]|uniref:Uncharacterized protein n=1 Tax=Candidatus Gemmiger excrementigallinarum TaxID=2838609 RepID=A0A9D2EP19_9FIRM|nr:hypothetical protein [Candidatus Gemmiger excrementigallinarum]
MAEKKMTAPVLAHRDGRNKELTKKLTIIVPLLRAAVKTAAVTLGIYLLAAVAALNVPALVGGVLALNALLGIWFALDEEVAT